MNKRQKKKYNRKMLSRYKGLSQYAALWEREDEKTYLFKTTVKSIHSKKKYRPFNKIKRQLEKTIS